MAKKVKIENLQNVVLEGGGAKGVVYVGAIEAIEDALKKHYGKRARPGAKAILDFGAYHKNSPGEFTPQVTRFAGSSAGAITAFALALGLSADQIAEVSKFPFSKFLKDNDPGKYRMVAANGQSYIGEDRGKLLGRGDGCTPYKFTLSGQQKVLPSYLAATFRQALVGQIVAMLLAGFFASIAGFINLCNKLNISRLLETLGEGIFDALPISLPEIALYAISVVLKLVGDKTLQPVKPNQSPAFAKWQRFGPDALTFVLEWWVRRLTSRSISAKLSETELATLIWDRGMFSGFAVREFFYDLMLYASVENTHFHRTFFAQGSQAALNAVLLSVVDGRQQSNFDDVPEPARTQLKNLPSLTFREFRDATKIDLILCVSNYSTDEPIFFSAYWTPEFPILEALGASMSIPPAIKPVYNEANVIGPKASEVADLYARDKNGKSFSGPVKPNDAAYFDSIQYELDNVAIKLMLAKASNTPISANNQIGMSGLLPWLRKTLQDWETTPGRVVPPEIDGAAGINLEMLYYHYNAAFKGLLIDGGYRCNIPYNIFRADTLNSKGIFGPVDPYLDHTLAIKLDDTYPKEWIDAVYKTLSKSIDNFKSPGYLTSAQENWIARLLHRDIRAVVRRLKDGPTGSFMDEGDIRDLNDDCYKRIATDVAAIYRKMNAKNRTPWNRQKSILAIAVEGSSYGSENGQIRFLSDHAHIVPLYSYGVGVYDFDLSKLGGLVSLSQAKARKQMDEYFS